MLVRRQFVLDKYTDRLGKKLARRGNRSAMVRTAIHYWADMESRLDEIEKDPGFLAMMKASEEAIRAGRFVSHEAVKKKMGRGPSRAH